MLYNLLILLNRFFVIGFFGPNASGKGTQKTFLVKFFEKIGGKTLTLSTGDLCRQYHKEETDGEYWQEIDDAFSKGSLVSDSTIEFLVMKYHGDLKSNPKKYFGYVILLDGVPRTVKQAKWIRKDFGIDIDLLIKLDVSRQECVKRTLGRNRQFDTETDANTRYDIFEEVISDLEEVYRTNIVTVNGQDLELRVHEAIVKNIKTFFKKQFDAAFNKYWV